MKKLIIANLMLGLCFGCLMALEPCWAWSHMNMEQPALPCVTSIFNIHPIYLFMVITLILSAWVNSLMMTTYAYPTIRKRLAIGFASVMSLLVSCIVLVVIMFGFRLA